MIIMTSKIRKMINEQNDKDDQNDDDDDDDDEVVGKNIRMRLTMAMREMGW